MDKWKEEARRIRAGIKNLPAGWPFHLRPDLREEHDRLYAQGRKSLNAAAELRSLALHAEVDHG